MYSDKDTIIAVATAPGQGGVGIIRISGPDLSGFIHTFFSKVLKPRHAYFLPFLDSKGEMIDEGIALYFKGPHSYTGEDVLELQGHGGSAVLNLLLNQCIEIGKTVAKTQSDFVMRIAQAGEFTQRAFLNGRLDLTQAEAVADLISASSEASAKSAVNSLKGDFSKEIKELDKKIIHLRMLLEATLDFPEEEIEFLEKYQAQPQLDTINTHLDIILSKSKQGVLLRDGIRVVLVGAPNVGKSSLLNALAGDDIAIVTDIAGTTRDRVIQEINIQGVPIHIVDTAGLRETTDKVESIGIKKTWEEIEKSDVILYLRSCDQKLDSHSEQNILNKLPQHIPVFEVINKIDLEADNKSVVKYSNNFSSTYRISAKECIGLEGLQQAILEMAGYKDQEKSTWLARERHVESLNKVVNHINLAVEHSKSSDLMLDLFAEELRLAHECLCEITGEYTSDDLLGEIFSGFCIGK